MPFQFGNSVGFRARFWCIFVQSIRFFAGDLPGYGGERVLKLGWFGGRLRRFWRHRDLFLVGRYGERCGRVQLGVIPSGRLRCVVIGHRSDLPLDRIRVARLADCNQSTIACRGEQVCARYCRYRWFGALQAIAPPVLKQQPEDCCQYCGSWGYEK
jgi:hypothetical protein